MSLSSPIADSDLDIIKTTKNNTKSNLKKRAPRYYAQWDHEYWRIFDRQYTSRHGEVRHIATCIGRHSAYRIRDALNKTEPSR